MKQESPVGLTLKITMMVLALVGVFYFMSRLNSSVTEPQVGEKNPLAMLFGDDMGRPLNWCPNDVQRVQVEGVPEELVTNQTQIQSYCQILTEGFDNSKLDLKSFKPIIKAFGASGKEFVIEADSSGKVFRFQGLPFGSKQLSRQLDKKIQH